MTRKLVIFDFDGTLVDTRRLVVTTMRDVLAELGLPVAEEAQCLATIGMPLRQCYSRLVSWLTAEQLDECYDAHQRLFDKNMQTICPTLFPNVETTLKSLKKNDVLLSVASSRSTHSLHDLSHRLGLDIYFDFMVGAHDVEHHKPHPEAVIKTLASLEVDKDNALVVGDTVLDIAMGRDAGVTTCGVTYGVGKKEELVAAGAKYIVDDIGEVERYIV